MANKNNAKSDTDNGNLPCFPIPEFTWPSAAAEAVFYDEEDTFYARHLFDNVLFRRRKADNVAQTFFLRRKLELEQEVADIAEADFIAQFRAGVFGRFWVHKSEKFKLATVPLFFLPDGTGFFQEEKGFGDAKEDDTVAFTWQPEWIGLHTFGEILSVEEPILSTLCEKVFVEQVWPRMRDPHPESELPRSERARFVCGSQAELERIVRLICWATPELYADVSMSQFTRIVFPAAKLSSITKGDTEKNRKLFTGNVYAKGYEQNKALASRMDALLGIVFAHNLFTGGKWVYTQKTAKRVNRFQFVPRTIVVKFPPPPTAHERIEALAELADWLDGKITSEEIRALLMEQA